MLHRVLSVACCAALLLGSPDARAVDSHQVHLVQQVEVDGEIVETIDLTPSTGDGFTTSNATARTGYIFTHWSTSAVQEFANRDPWGRAYEQVSFSLCEGMTNTAHYVKEDLDEDGDGIPDGMELYWYGDLDETPTGDTDGDGFTFAEEIRVGTSPLFADRFTHGVMCVSAKPQFFKVVLKSEPEGSLFATVTTDVAPGVAFSTDAYSPNTSSFACWLQSGAGVATRDAFGRAYDALSFTMPTNDVELVAVCRDDEAARQSLYWYGNETTELTSDTDGDGFTFAEEIRVGTSPLFADRFTHGVMCVSAKPQFFKVVLKSEPEGSLFATVTTDVAPGVAFSTDAYSPNTSSFACWLQSGAGVATRDAFGRAYDALSFTMPTNDVELVAVCRDDEAARQSLYWYGNETTELTSDTDGDGFTFAEEIRGGTSPLFADRFSRGVIGATQKPVIGPVIMYVNLKGAANENPTTYQEGTTFAFADPGAVTGYTFAGWTPSAITADMTGAQAVYANWKANSYTIAYDPNGGAGTMDGTACTYDENVAIATNGFTRANYRFVGWATEKDGEAVYEAGASVSNLVSNQNGVITFYAVWKIGGVPAPTVTPADGTVFTGDSCTVTLSCALEGAKIYYRTDGKTPKTNDTYLYTGAFTVTNTVAIKAVAVYDEVKSAYVTVTITKKTLTLAESLGLGDATGVALTTGGDAEWMPVADATATLGMSARSGAVGDEGESWLKATVNGAGVFTFKWKTDCEYDDSGAATWDHLEVLVDGEEFGRTDGETAWEEKTVTFSTSGEHTICWTYAKDESDASGADCAWVTECTWTPIGAREVTIAPTAGGASFTIPATWFAQYPTLGGTTVAEWQAIAEGNGVKAAPVWQDYVAGTDPTNALSKFTAKIEMKDGAPVVTWSPALNGEGAREGVRVYRVWGKENLNDESWSEVEAGGETGYRFFRVTVEMP